ncbi:helix-turn-helix domain-containing protein [Spongiactinospora gelatinilytica]|uniref:helix-turn-helix domain-containing protein n=1 Tax=Spongiactinospora gelatinilytica TaxID=2666298 RepID=UPI001313DFC9
MRTLGVFLEYSGSWNTCAERPHVRADTVRYRMRRAEEPTGGHAPPAGPISSLLYQ